MSSPDDSDRKEKLHRACAELEQRLRNGQPCSAEEILAAQPELAENPTCAWELIYTEFVARLKLGQRPQPEQWLARFPRWQVDLQQIFHLHQLAWDTDPGSLLTSAPPSQSSSAQLPDIRRLGDYDLLDEIGRGAMGVVYRARQSRLSRTVAVKVIRAAEHAGTEEWARFRAEAEVVARMQHPNIVQIFEVGEDNGLPFFSLEYVDGGSLADKLAEPWPARAAANLVETLARAIHHAHQRGVVHRDLKPANVLFAADGTPRITDFGLAKRLDVQAGPTQSGTILGTPCYMAPEQAAGHTRKIGPACDVYALGAVLYELLTGRPPFQGKTVLETLQQVLTEQPIPLRRLTASVPWDLETICQKCLSKEMGQRYASAEELADDLARFTRGEPIRARPPGPVYRFRMFAARHKAAVAGVTTVIFTLLLGMVGTGVGMIRARGERDRAILAEQETRALLAESFVQAGHLAMRRGAWRSALDNFDYALRAGHPEDTALRLQRVRAWCALHEVGQATRELKMLSRRTDLGELRGAVLLWQADLVLGQWAEDEKALTLVRDAVRAGLPPAEAAYAQGLLAQTSPEAVKQFQRALSRDPFHQRAHAMLGLLLITLGRLSDASERVAVAGLLFPDDPTFHLQRALISALQGNMPAARAALEPARGQLGPRRFKAARSLTQLAHWLRGLSSALTGDPATSLARVALSAIPFGAQMSAALQTLKAPSDPSSSLLLPIPPVLVKAMRSVAGILPRTLRGFDRDKALEALSESLAIQPNGLFYHAQGLLLVDRGDWEKAEQAFADAIKTPSLIPIEPTARFCAACCQWVLAGEPGLASATEMQVRARENTRKLLSQGKLHAEQADMLAKLAAKRGEVDLARAILADWEREASWWDLRPLRRRLDVEVKAKSYGAAVQAANRILARWPFDADAKSLRDTAITGLRDQVRKLP